MDLLTSGSKNINIPHSHINFNLNSTTATGIGNPPANSQQIRWNIDGSDHARIMCGQTASNQGFMEIATADDFSEPIHVRQYQGQFNSITRTLTLLDESGNTSIPLDLNLHRNLLFRGSSAGNDPSQNIRFHNSNGDCRVSLRRVTNGPVILELATTTPSSAGANQWNQEIQACQYLPSFNVVAQKRTLTLLDVNGNTTIPGNLNVTGNINNTSLTATINTAIATAMNNCFPVGTFMMFAGAASANNGGMDQLINNMRTYGQTWNRWQGGSTFLWNGWGFQFVRRDG